MSTGVLMYIENNTTNGVLTYIENNTTTGVLTIIILKITLTNWYFMFTKGKVITGVLMYTVSIMT